LNFVKNQSACKSGVSAEVTDEPKTHVTVCDINKAMLDVGKQKAAALGLDKSGQGHFLLHIIKLVYS
jgi:ubiquinone/menaquinone biosynthesis C-methylase UbiE